MSLEFGFEARDYFCDNAEHLTQGGAHFDDAGRRDFITAYVQGEHACETDILTEVAADSGLYSYAEKIAFTFEYVAGNTFDRHNMSGRVKDERVLNRSWGENNNVKPAMPVFTRAVVNPREHPLDEGVTVVETFTSRVGLYRLKPDAKLLWEFQAVKGCVLESSSVTVDGKLDLVLYIGGRIGAKGQGTRIPHRRIKSRSELIEELTKFESEAVLKDIDGGYEREDDCPLTLVLFRRSVAFRIANSGSVLI